MTKLLIHNSVVSLLLLLKYQSNLCHQWEFNALLHNKYFDSNRRANCVMSERANAADICVRIVFFLTQSYKNKNWKGTRIFTNSQVFGLVLVRKKVSWANIFKLFSFYSQLPEVWTLSHIIPTRVKFESWIWWFWTRLNTELVTWLKIKKMPNNSS